MTKNEIRAKHKEWAIKQVELIRVQLKEMIINKPQLRNLNQANYQVALSDWKKEYSRLESESKEIFNNWNNGVDFIY